MSQHDMDIANAAGAAIRADLNLALAALVSNSSGAAEPTTKFAYQWWADTTTGLLKIRNAANTAWITVGTLASANLGMALLAGAAFTGAVSVAANLSTTGTLSTSNTTASTTHATGALLCAGGAGISGALNVGGDITAYATSDERLKTEIVSIANALDILSGIRGVTHKWTEASGKDTEVVESGVIAQEVRAMLPNVGVVTEREDGFLAVRYERLVPYLIQAVNELSAKVAALEARK